MSALVAGTHSLRSVGNKARFLRANLRGKQELSAGEGAGGEGDEDGVGDGPCEVNDGGADRGRRGSCCPE